MARRRLSNAEIARSLREMSLFLEMEGVPFKPRAYEKAANAVESLDEPLAAIDAEAGPKGLEAVPAVGRGIAGKIDELLRTGRIADLVALRRKTPVDVLALTAIEGIGPKLVKTLYDALGVRSPADLEKACRQGRVRCVPHFGSKLEQRILRGIELQKQVDGRHPIGSVLPMAREIAARLRESAGVKEVAVAGSIRRAKETIGDLDFLVATAKPAAVVERFVAMPEVVHVYAKGESKTLVRLASDIDADLRVVPIESFGSALAYFTGSKSHNIALRRIAQRRGLKLNEYGIFRGSKRVGGRTEEEVYAALELPWIPPELRENQGEIEAAQSGRVPRLIQPGALRGDLQVHSEWTDGDASIEEMARAARALGLEYIAITDHTRDLTVANGNDEALLLRQVAAIRKLNRRLRGIRVLTGAEVNIRKDGSLDIDDEVLARLEVVGAAIHSDFRQTRREVTRRVIRAMENPHVDILFHPTARTLGKRAPVAFDAEAIIAAARRTHTVLEVDAIPERLDLSAEHVRKAVEAGVKLVIDSDAHDPGHLGYCDEYGLPLARRGWARKADVLNTLPVGKLLARLKGGRSATARS